MMNKLSGSLRILILPVLFSILLFSCRKNNPGAAVEPVAESVADVNRSDDMQIINRIFFTLTYIEDDIEEIMQYLDKASAFDDPDPISDGGMLTWLRENMVNMEAKLLECRLSLGKIRGYFEELEKHSFRTENIEVLTEQYDKRLNRIESDINILKGRIREYMGDASYGGFADYSSEVMEKIKSGEQLQSGKKVYYAMGTRKELAQKKIIKIPWGINRSIRVNQKSNIADYQSVYADSFFVLDINRKGAVIVSPHPSDSYRLLTSKGVVESLVITDADRFWQDSKVLVIYYKR